MRRAGFYKARDFLLRTEHRGCRVSLTRCTDLLAEALGRWDWKKDVDGPERWSAATRDCFGPLLAGTIALNGFQKGDERVETLLRDRAGNSLARVESTHSGVVRAAFPRDPFLAPTVPEPHELVVSKVLYHQADPFLSTVTNESAPSASGLWDRFFVQSEQIPTLALVRTKLASDGTIELCAGLTIQGLVGHEESSPQELINSFREDLPSADVLDGLVGENGADWMRSVLPDLPEDFEVKERDDPERGKLFTLRPVSFFCPCSVERMTQSIAGLAENPDEIFEPENDALEVVCSYCNSKHEVTRDAVHAVRKTPTEA